ncbi:MAG TPA: hemerythrin domain-containing protein [Ottowia sp.]|uniref:hemerythrin domain-containing protein n=1 Tax=Ottowia sp. TaxID=1898956 RepID=UPI002D17079F|nr:hemerythrin domain-containing protein [Ottowia sp.]HMN20401.1 hemerythrin domain-containing protein [Ottowia sp.]
MKRDPRLVGLSREHHHALVLAVHLGKAVRAHAALDAAAHELARRFRAEIEPHFRVEEEILLPALRALGADSRALVRRAEADHAWLRAGAARAEAGASDHLAAWGERLAAHVRFEERELFEHAQQVLAPQVLDALARARPATPVRPPS